MRENNIGIDVDIEEDVEVLKEDEKRVRKVMLKIM